VEAALYEAAPDLTSLSLEGLDPPTGGFVAVSQLSGSALPASPSFDRGAAVSGDD
jgi:hypothetical protein